MRSPDLVGWVEGDRFWRWGGGVIGFGDGVERQSVLEMGLKGDRFCGWGEGRSFVGGVEGDRCLVLGMRSVLWGWVLEGRSVLWWVEGDLCYRIRYNWKNENN